MPIAITARDRALGEDKGEHWTSDHRSPPDRSEAPGRQTATTARRLLDIVVYGMCCRTGGTISLNALADFKVGDWQMPDLKAARAYAASQAG
jgi:hypothetical protein